MTDIEIVISTLEEQRNSALNALVNMNLEKTKLQLRVNELEAQLKPVEPIKESKHGKRNEE